MLKLTVAGEQSWNPRTEEFEYAKPVELRLEHSLLSLAKWESKWHVPFLTSSGNMTREQQLDYISCMTVTQGTDPAVYRKLTREQLTAINEYMDDPMTATWFAGEPKPNEPKDKRTARPKRRPPHGGTTTTAEVLYAQMFALGIPKECEKWHLNRLLTLIRVGQEMNAPQKKMTPGERMSQQRALNAQRKAKMHTRG
jgi:hypothetical protein